MIDFPAWRPDAKADEEGRGFHAHNRLIASIAATAEERCGVARLISEKLSRATGRTAYILPRGGVEAWDRPGQPMYAPEGLAAFLQEARATAPGNADFIEIDAHINDRAFADKALEIFDRWVADGVIAAAR